MAASRSNWSEKEGKARCGGMSQQQFSPPRCRICHLSIISIGSPRFGIPSDPELRRRNLGCLQKGLGVLRQKVAKECFKRLRLRSRAFALPRGARRLLAVAMAPTGSRLPACLGGSSPVASCFHVICSKSADQLERLKHFGGL